MTIVNLVAHAHTLLTSSNPNAQTIVAQTGVKNDGRKEVEEEGAGLEGEQLVADVQLLEGIAKDEANNNQQGTVRNRLPKLLVHVKY
jgi:hypothetical protein